MNSQLAKLLLGSALEYRAAKRIYDIVKVTSDNEIFVMGADDSLSLTLDEVVTGVLKGEMMLRPRRIGDVECFAVNRSYHDPRIKDYIWTVRSAD